MNQTFLRGLASLLLVFLLVPTTFAEDPPDHEAVVEALGETLTEVYVFPEVAEKMKAHLEARLADGAYEGMGLDAFCLQLTQDMIEISQDLHLSVRSISPDELDAEREIDQEAARARRIESARRGNYGFRKVEILPGNVGYLDLRGFFDASLGGPTAVAAMRFLAGVDGLIVDLRQNGGGSPSMIQLLSSYFFDEPQHLNSFYIRREDTTRQFWTQAHVEGEKMVDTPIWVLTSGRTFSAAEEFSYNLKNMERAILVGETTGGGAHPVSGHELPELRVRLMVPFGRAVNPITETNWEGTGVAPHVEVPADRALDVAYTQALEKQLATADDDRKADIEWVLTALRAEQNPIVLDPEALADYPGAYGPRRVWIENGILLYRREGRPASALVPLGEDLFALQENDFFRVRFERDADGRVTTLVGLYQGGRAEPSPRTGDAP